MKLDRYAVELLFMNFHGIALSRIRPRDASQVSRPESWLDYKRKDRKFSIGYNTTDGPSELTNTRYYRGFL